MKNLARPMVMLLSGAGGLILGSAVTALTLVREPVVQQEDTLVTGIGGVFFKAEDAEGLRAWYRDHLGIDAGAYGVNFFWREPEGEGRFGRTVWAIFPRDTDYFGPGGQELMVNYRVSDLSATLARLREQGVQQVGEVEEYWYGRFAWIIDGEGNRVELWEPDNYSPSELERRMKSEGNRN